MYGAILSRCKREFRVLTISLYVLIGINSSSAIAGTLIQLKFAHYANLKDPINISAEYFRKLVETRANGKVKIRIFPSRMLGNSQEMVHQARLGLIDLIVVPDPYFADLVPKMHIIDLPFIFHSKEHAYRVLDGSPGRQLLYELKNKRMKGLAFWEVGFRSITNSARPISSLSDMKGLKIRTIANKDYIRVFEKMGAVPVPLSFSEVYMALQKGVVDGQEGYIKTVADHRLYEVQRYLSLTQHSYTAAPLVMNLEKFRSLNTKLQKVITSAAVEAAWHQRKLNAKFEEETLKKVMSAGMQVTEAPKFDVSRHELAKGARRDYAEKFGVDILYQIDKAK